MAPQQQNLTPPQSYSQLPFKQIRVSHHPASSPEPTPIIIVTLYRPEHNNAFTDVMLNELESLFPMLSVDDRVKCAVVTGHGRIFCAGADLSQGFRGREGMERGERGHRDGGGRVSLSVFHCQKPVIGAIQGPAVGVGITLTLPMTIRIALSSAKIGFVFSRRGLVPEAASSYFLPRLIGYAKALHVCTTGAVYKADDKLLEGLFSETRDTPEEVVKRALEIAEEIAGNTSTVSNVLTKEMIWRGPGSAEETHLLDSRVLHGLQKSEDNDEGVKSFLERRPPRFTGTMTRDTPPVYPWWNPIDTGLPAKSAVETGKPKL